MEPIALVGIVMGIPTRIGKYRIESVLGQGASSVVYRAVDLIDERKIALKVVRAELLTPADRQEVLTRFRLEAELGSRMRHPGIVPVYDSGDIGGVPFIAMGLIEGPSLAEWAARTRPGAGRALAMMGAVLDILQFVHEAGVIHRDVKPANIMLVADDQPVLADFGIARVSGSELTQTGDMMGTPAYMAPEQLEGRRIDFRADLFAAGVLLYTLLTGRRPFGGSVATTLRQVLFTAPPPVAIVAPNLPREVDAMLQRALAKRPDERFQSAREMAEACRGLQSLLGPMSEPASGGAATADGAAPDEPAFSEPVEAGVDVTEQAGRQLVELLSVITDQALSEATISRVAEILKAWGRRQATLAAVAPVEAEREREILNQRVAPVLPRLEAIIIGGMPTPGEAATDQAEIWLKGIRLLRSLAEAVGTHDQGGAIAEAVRRIGYRAVLTQLLYGDRLGAVLAVDDDPDIATLSMDFLRLDAIAMGLLELEAGRELAITEANLALLACQVIRRISAQIQAYQETGDPTLRFGLAAVWLHLDDLLVMAERALAPLGDASGDDAGTVVASPLAAVALETIDAFIAGAVRLSYLTVDELRDALTVGDAASARLFAGRLKQLRQICLFAVRLPAKPFEHRLATLVDDIRTLVELLVEHAFRVAGTGRNTAPYLAALFEVATALNWKVVQGRILKGLQHEMLPAASP